MVKVATSIITYDTD